MPIVTGNWLSFQRSRPDVILSAHQVVKQYRQNENLHPGHCRYRSHLSSSFLRFSSTCSSVKTIAVPIRNTFLAGIAAVVVDVFGRGGGGTGDWQC